MTIPPPFPGELHESEEDQYLPSAEEAAVGSLVYDLGRLTQRMSYLEQLRSEFIAELRTFGISWAEIARCLHISRQAAWKQYRHLDRQ